MVVGQTVYTVNNETNEVDEWKYAGALPTKDELLIHLMRNRGECFLPARCVFETHEKALAVAEAQ